MGLPGTTFLALPGLLAGLVGCAGAGHSDPGAGSYAPIYQGGDVLRLDDTLVAFNVRMSGARGEKDVEAYARCMAAGYTMENNYGFARHVRTKIDEEGGVWRADAVYTISPSLPRGLRTIDAEVTVADCAERGIPTV
ncbi:MAG: hypothetical protein H6901_05800 [Rhodobacteraceae bacterium]|nr:hypothetical protein [Paracoccaceae bacterium]MCP5341708.1 hypothetical protein [Paracoccaceae bacterium]